MPRPRPPRELVSEKNVARRVAYEREQRGWSYAGLALRMEKKGCKIDQSALYKIEKAKPPRRITVDELVAFGEVFELSLVELTTPLETIVSARMLELLSACRAHYEALRDTIGDTVNYMESVEPSEVLYRQNLQKNPDYQLMVELVARFTSAADAT